MCFVDNEKAFDRVPRKMMEWAMTKKCLPQLIVRAVVRLYHGEKTKVKVGSELSEKLMVQISVHQEFVFAAAFCNCGGCNCGECKITFNE